MKIKPVIPRRMASRDVDEVLVYYLAQGDQLGLDFVEALERALTHIGRHPASGSSRYAHELNLPGLRHWPLARFPHLIFYVERADHIDVWRVLHAHRDIASWMRESDDGGTS